MDYTNPSVLPDESRKYRLSRIDSCRRQTNLAAATSAFSIVHRLVPPPPAGLAGVGRSGEPDLCVEFSVKVVFSKY
jgi:hypothetical protein